MGEGKTVDRENLVVLIAVAVVDLLRLFSFIPNAVWLALAASAAAWGLYKDFGRGRNAVPGRKLGSDPPKATSNSAICERLSGSAVFWL